MTIGGRTTTMKGVNFPAGRHFGRPIPKRGRVKAGIVIRLANSFIALLSQSHIVTNLKFKISPRICFKRVRNSAVSKEEERHKDDYWWKKDDDEWRSELSSKEAFWAVKSEEGKSEGRDNDTVG
ncbi:hypothetical protein NE237_032423 [Protea cynaroides]|uniref:Uncharacterized protein n=1 Tax=Protea cynaroides TaxID=273540 RepID=A0A9Q0L3Z8_9MAGN|nr:hypothetical protein NE237_032423 [Protea cynaroides]